MTTSAARLRRARVLLGAAGLIMLLGLGWLLRGALEASAREQQLRREALVARVFDELEASLASFVVAEEARPFVQWRREWVLPTTTKKASTDGAEPKRSPLAELPERAFVLGYFQIEPDGSFASPMLPEEGERADLDPELLARVEQLRGLNEDLTDLSDPRQLAFVDVEGSAIAEPEPQQQQQRQQRQQANPPPLQQVQKAVPEDVQIQRALDQQSIVRQRKTAAANASLNAFDPDLDQLSSFLGADGGIGSSADALDLRVTSFVGEAVGERELRLIRTVEIGGRRWVQGLVLDRRELEAWLEADVLGSPELAQFVTLDWRTTEPAATDADVGRYVHEFAAPFSQLRVAASLGPAAPLAATGARLILSLGLGLGLALVLVLVAVERTLTGLHARAEERERFVAAVTHELRTPLTSIRMYSEMLEQGIVTEPERQTSYHGTIRAEAERLSRLVEQVLTLARVEGARSLVAEAERAPLGEIVDGVLALLEAQGQARGVELEASLDAVARAVRLPRDPLAQILTNLLDNALKFTPEGGAAIELSATGEGSRVLVCVRDRGPGVEAEALAKIFEPFVRGRREHERAVAGTGIGLAVVRALVDELGGQVSGRNREGGGFEVQVELPGVG